MQLKKAVLKWLVCFCALLWGITVHAQEKKTISGIVKDSSGASLSGVTISVKGGKLLGTTDETGHFSVEITPSQNILTVNLVGFVPKDVIVGSLAQLSVVLLPVPSDGNAVVVTSLGIRRTAQSLTYATQQIKQDELLKAKDPNLMNSLNGKIAGVYIARSASGVGGSTKVILRGNKSVNGNNQPLYVIDGIPMSTGLTITQPNSTWGGIGAYDGGDGISNLNPDDIESMNVLKGPSAAALYGSQAANGAILIVTKRAKPGISTVNFSSGFNMDKATSLPEYQTKYGQLTAGAKESWSKTPLTSGGNYDLNDYFRTGNTFTNSINFAQGSDKGMTYFSYANTRSRGIQPTTNFMRHNANLKETAKFFDDKLTLDGNINYIYQKTNNAPMMGLYFNPLTGLYLFPRGEDLQSYKDNYQVEDPTRNLMTQNWVVNEDLQQNPWWISNKNTSTLTRNRVLMNASIKYEFSKYFNVAARGSFDRINDLYDFKAYAGTNPVLAATNGAWAYSNITARQLYGDLLGTFVLPDMGKLKINGVVGTSIMDSKANGDNISTGLFGLNIPNVFTLQNITMPTNTLNTLPENHSQLQSVFGQVSLNYNDVVYLDLTGRNDWSSNLSYTNNGSYFYPSAGLSFLLGKLIQLPDFINYSKFRVSYAQVGNTVPNYYTNPLSHNNTDGTVTFNTVAPFTELKPEKTKSWEAGMEWRMFNSRLNFDLTVYKTNTTNQYFAVSVPAGTGFTSRYINAGNIENKGVEVMIGYDIINGTGKNFKWNSSLNASYNVNKVLELAPGVDQFVLTGTGSNAYQSVMNVGGSYGDIYSIKVVRDDQGRVVVDGNGMPTKESTYTKAGNANPKWMLGWNNGFSYAGFTLSALVDAKLGGQVMSMTQSIMDLYGVSKLSGDARDAGGLTINGVDASGNAVTKVDAQTYLTAIGGRAGALGEYMYSASVIRLREANFGYTFPLKSNFFHSMKLALYGRNLAYFHKKAPYDPEVTMSTGNGLSGVDVFSMPALRSYGISLNVSF